MAALARWDDPEERRVLDRLVGGPAARPDRVLAIPDPVRADPAACRHRRRRGPVLPAPDDRPDARQRDPGAGRRAPGRRAAPAPGGSCRSRSRCCTSRPGRSRTPSVRSGCGWSRASRALILAAIGLVALGDRLLRRRPSSVPPPRSGPGRHAARCVPSRRPWRPSASSGRSGPIAATPTSSSDPDRVPGDSPPARRHGHASHDPDATRTGRRWSGTRPAPRSVAVLPPGYAKLAFDPACSPRHGQADRRRRPGERVPGVTLRHSRASPIDTAPGRIVLARRGAAVGLVSRLAALAAAGSGATAGPTRDPARQRLGRGRRSSRAAASAFPQLPVGQPIDLEIRVLPRLTGGAGDGPAGIETGDPDAPAITAGRALRRLPRPGWRSVGPPAPRAGRRPTGRRDPRPVHRQR